MKNNLRKIMKEKHITQRYIGYKTGYTPQAIGRFVRGEALPNVILAQIIAKILEVDVSEIWEVE